MTTTTNPKTASNAILVADPDPLASDRTCSAFMFCGRPAIGWIKVVPGAWIPCCARCAGILEEALRYQCQACGNYARPAEALTSYPCGERAEFGVECLNCAEEGHVACCDSCAVAEREAHED